MPVGPPNVSFVPRERLMIFSPCWSAQCIARDVFHRVPIPIYEVISMARAVGRTHPHVRLQVLMGPPDTRVDDRHYDGPRAQRHISGGIRADFTHTPLAYAVEIRIVRMELRMNGKVRGDGLGADDRTRGPGDERADDREDGQKGGHPAQRNASSPSDQQG